MNFISKTIVNSTKTVAGTPAKIVNKISSVNEAAVGKATEWSEKGLKPVRPIVDKTSGAMQYLVGFSTFGDLISQAGYLEQMNQIAYLDSYVKSILGFHAKLKISPNMTRWLAMMGIRKLLGPPKPNRDVVNFEFPVGHDWDYVRHKEYEYSKELPFPMPSLPKGGSRNLENFELDTQFYWDISLKKYSDRVPDNPYNNGWLPVVEYTLTYDSLDMKSVDLISGQSIEVPQGVVKSPKITLSVIENSKFSFHRYLEQYYKAIYQDGKVLPYKDALSLLTLYVTDPRKKILFKKEFYVIPNIKRDRSGLSNQTVNLINLDFSIVGETDNVGIYGIE